MPASTSSSRISGDISNYTPALLRSISAGIRIPQPWPSTRKVSVAIAGPLIPAIVDGLASLLERLARPSVDDAAAITRFHWDYERGVIDSIERFVPQAAVQRTTLEARLAVLQRTRGTGGKQRPAEGDAARVYRRNPNPKGPMVVFGYDYLADRLGKDRADALQLRRASAAGGYTTDYAPEALNFVDGRRSVQDIRDALTAEFGPVPVEHVAEYLQAVEQVGVLRH